MTINTGIENPFHIHMSLGLAVLVSPSSRVIPNIFQYQTCDLRIIYLVGYYKDDLPSFLVVLSCCSSCYSEEYDVCQMDLGGKRCNVLYQESLI